MCHALWESPSSIHVCGRRDGHDAWHLCACGEMLLTGRTSLSDEQRQLREHDCPTCLAKAGRPCHTTMGAVMSGVHADRASFPSAHQGERGPSDRM